MFFPFLDAFHRNAYSVVEHEIFPSYFHGKCQRPDPHGQLVNPIGCPNPDCPVICGTPGSMVHFFPKLKQIVFNGILKVLSALLDPKSKEFKEVLDRIRQEAEMARQQKSRRSWMGRQGFSTRGAKVRRAEEARINQVATQEISKLPSKVEELCGGAEALPNCSWETVMKQYILSHP
jgi:hypothetical protein